jgi:thiol-disulfide isomerase/thioredoxin
MMDEHNATGDDDGAPVAGRRTITVGLWPGLAAMLVVTALAAWLVLRPWTAPPMPPAAAVLPATPLPAALSLAESPDGELAPGTVLDVAKPGHPLAGASAPEITGTLLGGQPARLSEYRGKPVLVNFWATWCPPCRLEMPWLEEAYRQRAGQGLVVLAVNAGENVAPDLGLAKVRRYVAGAGLTFPVLMPADADRAQYDYQALNLPTSVLVDPTGKVTAVVDGAFPNRATLNATLDRLLGAGTAPAR